jgi:hypothetical protein
MVLKIDFMILWVVMPCNVDTSILEDFAASIFRVEVCGEWTVDIGIGNV